MNVSRRGALLACGVLLSALNWQIVAATSPNISGTWSGKAAGTSYFEDNSNQTAGPVDKTERVSGSVNAVFVQNGNDLTVTATVFTQDQQTLVFNLTGRAGDFALWVAGVHTPAGENPETVFLAGVFDAKAKKFTGNMIVFDNNEVTNVAVSLKRALPVALSRAAGEGEVPEARDDDGSDELPFTVAGSLTGKRFTFSSNAKPAAFKSPITGAFTPLLKTATLTIVSTQEVFNVTEADGGKGLVLYGSSASSQILLFGNATKNSAAGTGWIYSDSGMTSFKWNAKKK